MENNVQTQKVPENLTPQQAIQLLVQGIHFAQSKGVFTIKDAALLDKAIDVFVKPEDEAKAPAAEAPAEVTTQG